jgi:CDP-diacylglycerol---glycerol-3-phosphate 3-phosphatidyltransferase
MNLPNQLTVARFFLTIVFVAALSFEWAWHFTVGLVVFIAAGITDYLDGAIARRRNLVTDFGKLMDPLADKIMIAAAFICLVPLHAIPAWAAVVIISREFLITGLRLLAAGKGVVLSSERLGKHKTAWQIVMVIYFLLLLVLKEWELAGRVPAILLTPFPQAWVYGGRTLLCVTLGLTLYSGIRYLWKHRALIASA